MLLIFIFVILNPWDLKQQWFTGVDLEIATLTPEHTHQMFNELLLRNREPLTAYKSSIFGYFVSEMEISHYE